MIENLDTIVDHALIAWLWSETDHDGNAMDVANSIEDVADCERATWREEIQAFLDECILDLAGMDPEQIGHDFTLTRNRHGAGFWDRGLGERGERLTESCQRFPEVSAYVGSNGKIGRI